MHDKSQSLFHTLPGLAKPVLALAIMIALAMLIQPAQGQTFKVIYNFPWGQGGGDPLSGVSIDRGGNLYGTTYAGGSIGNVYRLGHTGSGWVYSPLYNFQGGNDGWDPRTRPIIGSDHSLYGTTGIGGGTGCGGSGCGTVFNLRPPATACKSDLCYWTETVLYRFSGANGDLASPSGDLTLDAAGNIYGTAGGGVYNQGAVYKLTNSHGSWTKSILYNFTGGADGGQPNSGVVFGQSGNLYGVAYNGGAYGYGTVFELTPSGSGWTEKTLYTFTGQGDSGYPLGLVIDKEGNLYGVTIGEGCSMESCRNGIAGIGASTVFMLSPSQDNWIFTVLCNFSGLYDASLSIDTTRSLYVAVVYGGTYGNGYVFKLTPAGHSWIYTDLHDFNGNDGFWPWAVSVDLQGNIYGTTEYGGTAGAGVAFEITP